MENSFLTRWTTKRSASCVARGMTMTANPLGLSYDDENPLERVPLIIAYGEQKVGKTTAFAQAFSQALWITSDEAILRPFASWYRDNETFAKSQGIRDPRIPYAQGGMARKTIPALQDDGVTPFENWPVLNKIISRYLTAVQAGDCPFSGLVLDEFTQFSSRVYGDMQRVKEDRADPRFKTKNGGPDHYGPPRTAIEWHEWICSIPRAKPGIPSKFLGLVCHPEDPVLDEDQKGGPKLATKKSRRVLVHRADAILRFYWEKIDMGEDGGGGLGFGEEKKTTPEEQLFPGEVPTAEGLVRRIRTGPDPLWEGGIRDFGVESTVKLDLRALLTSAGFVLER